jgi:hypothetical protein
MSSDRSPRRLAAAAVFLAALLASEAAGAATRQCEDNGTAALYLVNRLGTPILADYLQEGLAAFGLSCSDTEAEEGLAPTSANERWGGFGADPS